MPMCGSRLANALLVAALSTNTVCQVGGQDLEGSSHSTVTDAILHAMEKLICQTVSTIEPQVVSVVCNKINSLMPAMDRDDCEENINKVWQTFSSACPSDAGTMGQLQSHANGIIDGLEDTICSFMATTEEPEIATVVCSKISSVFPSIDVPSCENANDDVWEHLASVCANHSSTMIAVNGQLGHRANGNTDEIEKLICETMSKIEPQVARTVCTEINSLMPVMNVNDCEKHINKAWQKFSSACPSDIRSMGLLEKHANGISNMLENAICNMAFKEEPKIAGMVCTKIHTQFPSLKKSECEKKINQAWEQLATICTDTTTTTTHHGSTRRRKSKAVTQQLESHAVGMSDLFENAICNMAFKEEPKIAGMVCTKIHSQFPSLKKSECEQKINQAWEQLATICTDTTTTTTHHSSTRRRKSKAVSGLLESRANGIVDGFENAICDMALKKESDIATMVCMKIHSLIPSIKTNDCERSVEHASEQLATFCADHTTTTTTQHSTRRRHRSNAVSGQLQSQANAASGIVDGLEKAICNMASTKEPEIVGMVCAKIHTRIPTITAAHCEKTINRAWEKAVTVCANNSKSSNTVAGQLGNGDLESEVDVYF